ncbi:histone deacetylase family protein [Ostreiculturibacter nitratireducens]|uniref:histone deacetylase family protein n=1 Tax=Ostreiculturibacter nitratireducens TaxID=3075226 RepID=UPI0031B5BC2F
MTTILFSHEAALNHVNPPGHPERVARLEAILGALDAPEFSTLLRREAPRAEASEVLRCHPQVHLDRIEALAPERGFVSLDPDTYLSPGSLEAAFRAVGAAGAAVDAVLKGHAANAFVAMRPPGHHAEREKAMGFCLFGNVAIAAKRALDYHGLQRVAVLDFDVHHGNGTQDLLWDEARAFFASSHQMPLYPGSGHPSERGVHGQVMNVPLSPGTGGAEMRAAWEGILDRAREFQPELVLVSAGFDAHRDDPLAGLMWTESDFAWVTGAICDLAEETCAGRVVSCLEGGYDLDALAASVAAHVRVLMERGG